MNNGAKLLPTTTKKEIDTDDVSETEVSSKKVSIRKQNKGNY